MDSHLEDLTKMSFMIAQNNEILKKFQLDQKSWEGIQRKELHLKLKECSHFLKDFGPSSANHLLAPFVKHFLEKLQSVEEESCMKTKVTSSQALLNEIEMSNKSISRNIDFNEKLLSSLRVNMCSDEIENLSLNPVEECFIAEREGATCRFERINELLDKLEEQENEIKKLMALKKQLSP